MNIRERRAGDLEVVRDQLEAGEIPSKGFERTTGWIAEENGQIISHIALEETAPAMVLRSPAPAAQG